jgi:hypothetical protein
MNEYKIFSFLDKFKTLFIKAGVDYDVMKKIIQIKLTMDGRAVPTVLNNQKYESSNSSAFKKSLLSYGFMGVMIGIFMLISLPVFYKMNVIIGIIIFMVMLTMISDFSSVLLDVKDKNILLPRPINEKTIAAAKIIHIFIYLSIIDICIAGPSLVIGAFKYGIVFFIVFFFQLFLITAFVLFFTSLLYYIILKFFDGEKLKDIINYFQIILTVVMAVSYQFIGRIYEISEMNLVYHVKLWHYFLPSMWFTGAYSMIYDNNFSNYNICFIILSIILPIVGSLIYFKNVAPYFEKKLQKLGNNGQVKKNKTSVKSRCQKIIARLVCRDKTEENFYVFTWNMISSERKLKLSLYPNLAMSIAFPLIFLVNGLSMKKSFHENIEIIISGKGYFGIYMTVMFLITSVTVLCCSEKAKGAWVYKALPIKNPGIIFKGAIKAYIMKIVLPAFGVISFIFLIIFKFSIVKDILVIGLSLLVILILIFKLFIKQLPFSKEFNYGQNQNWKLGITSIVLSGGSALLHSILRKIPFAITVYIGVLALIVIIVWKNSFKMSWEGFLKE